MDNKNIERKRSLAMPYSPALMKIKRTRDQAIISMFFHHGIRPSELSALRVRDFEDHERVSFMTEMNQESRTVLLHPATRAAIVEYLAVAAHGRDHDAPLFQPITRRAATKAMPLSSAAILATVRRYF